MRDRIRQSPECAFGAGAEPRISPSDRPQSEARIPSERSRPPLHPGSPPAARARREAPPPSSGVFGDSPAGTSRSVFGLDLRTPVAACFRKFSKRFWEVFHAIRPGSARVAGTAPGGLYLTPGQGRSSIIEPLTGSTFWRLRDFYRFPLVADPQNAREGCGNRPSPYTVLD